TRILKKETRTLKEKEIDIELLRCSATLQGMARLKSCSTPGLQRPAARADPSCQQKQ
ncbi:Hypothetical predicted protein, partial [Marmota monax]